MSLQVFCYVLKKKPSGLLYEYASPLSVFFCSQMSPRYLTHSGVVFLVKYRCLKYLYIET